MWPTGETSPGPCHAVLTPNILGQDRDFARGRESARLGNVHADVVDEPFGDQRLPLVRAVEEFAHGDGRGAILPDLPEVADILRRERVFDEEHPELLGVLAELHSLVGRDPLVHVVQQLDFFAQFLPADLQQFQSAAQVDRRIEDRLDRAAPSTAARRGARTVAGHAGNAHLHAHVAESLRHDTAWRSRPRPYNRRRRRARSNPRPRGTCRPRAGRPACWPAGP